MNKEKFDKAYDLLNFILQYEIWSLRDAVYCISCPDDCTPDPKQFANDMLDQTIKDLMEVKKQLNEEIEEQP